MNLSEMQKQISAVNNWAQHGCGNHGCVIYSPKGIGTNSTCRCSPYGFSELLLAIAAELSVGGRHNRFTKEGDSAP